MDNRYVYLTFRQNQRKRLLVSEKHERSVSRRHHFVPRCYLSSFAVPRKNEMQVEVFDLIGRKQFSANTKNIAVSFDFNRVDMPGERQDFVETELSKWESEISSSIREVLNSRSLSVRKNLENLVLLATLLSTRTPKFRRFFKEMLEQSYTLAIDSLLSSKEQWEGTAGLPDRSDVTGPSEPDYESVKSLWYSGAFKIKAEIATPHYVQQEFRLLPEMLELMMQRKWGLFYAPSETGGFVTSDHPLLVTWTRPTPFHYSPGLGLRNTAVTLALSPSITLVGTFENCPELMMLSAERVALLNGATAAFAERQVYAKNGSFFYAFDHFAQPRKASRLLTEKRRSRE